VSTFENHDKVSLNELKTHIAALKTNKSSGYDKITCSMVKNLPQVAIELLGNVCNSCLQLGYFPKSWKIGKIIALSKPGKDNSLPGSYRPVSLLPVIGKIFEKMILTRLMEWEEEQKIFRPQQFGFRARHSTTQQILRITETVSLRFNNDKSTALTLLDIEKAFDSVWHDALRHKLLVHKFPVFLTKIISSFLEDRHSFVSLEQSESSKFPIPAGVPQGSPLSPFLFNLFINDMPIPRYCKVACYADDTALFSSISNYNLEGLIDRMERGLAEIHNYFDSWKVRLNSSKTETILFSHSRIMRKKQQRLKINFNGKLLEWLPSVKYLGVILDSKLLMRQNIENNVCKARKASGILFPLLKKFNSIPFREKINIYRSYLRPILTYACPVFANAAKTHIKKLQVAQNKSLRMALSARYCTRIHLLHDRSNIPFISDYISKLTENFYKKSATSANSLVSRLGEYSHRTLFPRLKHKLPRPSS
jgi:hypothetical protein